jgi:hypothetical protein
LLHQGVVVEGKSVVSHDGSLYWIYIQLKTV